MQRIGMKTVAQSPVHPGHEQPATYGDLLAALEASVRQVEQDRQATGARRP
jgi:hypothetical protein